MKQIYLSVFLFASFSMSLSAQVFVKSNASGANDGTSWANAYTNLDLALAFTSSGEIWVAAGTYKGGLTDDFFIVKNGVAVYGGFAGTETSLNQRNPVANVTVLSADANGDDIPGDFGSNRTDNQLHVVIVEDGAGAAAVVDGFTISGGNTFTSGDDFNASGGGILAFGPAVVRNCNLNNNFAAKGGALYLTSTAGGSGIHNCTFDDNLSIGALYVNWNDGVSVDSCTFTNNSNVTASSNAGAFYATNCTNLSLSNSEFSGNSAVNGGALYCVTDSLPSVTNPDNFVIANCSFLGNSNTTGLGGAARFRNCSYTLSDCSFEANTSASSGGHIRNDIQADDNVVYQNSSFKNASSGGWGGAFTGYGGTFTVTDCHFEGNTCAHLGGVSNNGFGGTMTYTGCTFLNNQATGTAAGGALALQNDLTTVSAINCEFKGNSTSGNGGAIFSGAQASSSPVNVTNCEFVGNAATSNGGAIYMTNNTPGINAPLTVDGSEFVGNVSDGFGGAIFMADNSANNDATLTVTNSIFDFNAAQDQGGAINLGDVNTTITSCLFTNNEAKAGTALPTGRGGAISINVDTATLEVTIMNCTFAYNIGEYAAAISNWTGASDVSFSNTVLQNNIFAQDGSINYAIEAGFPTITSNGGNLFDDDSFDTLLVHPKDLKVDDIDGMFVDPDDDNFRLQNDAVAVDAGVDAGAPALDLDGNPRLNEVDMGAYENQFTSKANEVLLSNDGILTVSPNPAAGQSATVTLDNTWAGNVQLRLTNLLGQEVRVFEVNKPAGKLNFELPLNGLGQGIYHLAASNGSQVVVQQLVRN